MKYVLLFLFMPFLANAACNYDVIRDGCFVNIICTTNGDQISQVPLTESSVYISGSSIVIRHPSKVWSGNIAAIDNFADIDVLLDSLLSWQADCTAPGATDTLCVIVKDTALVETVCENVTGEEGVGVYTGSSITLNADEYYSISILVSLDSIEITATNPIDGLPQSNFFLAGYTVSWTAPQCELLTEAITVDATTGQAVIAVIK